MSPVSNAMEHLAPKKLAMLLILVWYGAHVLSAPSKHGHHMDLADDIEEVSSNKHHIITDLPEDGAPEITDNDVFEGDIMGVDKEAFGSDPEGQGVPFANAIDDANLKWPDGIVPYKLGASFGQKRSLLILDAMGNIQDNTCIKFVHTTDIKEDQIWVLSAIGRCVSYVGRQGDGQQKVILSNGCMEPGSILHELMHALGFYHEHTRTDRDEYVEIIMDNVRKDSKNNFKKYVGDLFNLPYDFDSVMHYKRNEFAINSNSWTIKPKKERDEKKKIGQRKSLSKLDVRRINKLYNCPEVNKKVCGYLWTGTYYDGMMTVVYEREIESYYEKHERSFASGEVEAGCELYYYTEHASDGVTLPAGKYPEFQKIHRSRATKLECDCRENKR